MNLNIMGFEQAIEFNDQCDTLFIIENKRLYAKVITIINLLSQGKSQTNEVILKSEEKNIGFKNVLVIIDPFNIDLNSKKILNLLYSVIAENIDNDDILISNFRIKNQEITSILFEYIDELNLEFNYNEEVSVLDYLKVLGLKIILQFEETTKINILNYLEVISELMPKTIVFFCNILSYLEEDEILEICKYKNYKHIHTLFIENKYEGHFDFNKYVIDSEYMEFVL